MDFLGAYALWYVGLNCVSVLCGSFALWYRTKIGQEIWRDGQALAKKAAELKAASAAATKDSTTKDPSLFRISDEDCS